MDALKTTILLFMFTITEVVSEENLCSKAYGCSESGFLRKTSRYILYDVNPGEGFNLKRDVYMRMAIFVRDLAENSKDDWHLVLPPWTKQWHWRNENSDISYPWHNFFHVESLQLYSPVIEIDQYFSDYSKIVDEVYILQHFPEFYTWTEENKEIDWSDKWNYTECRDYPYWNETFLFFRGKTHVKAMQVKCISFQGTSAFLNSVVSSTRARSIMFDRAEIATHIMYGDSNYWMCRRSMRFAEHLVKAAEVFRVYYLNSSDTQDATVRPLDFREEKPHRSARGGPYLGVHLRRQDFQQGHPNNVPSLLESVNQIKKHLQRLNLTNVFVATDMTSQEYEYLSRGLHEDGLKSFRYGAHQNLKENLKEGELAIIDQIIASHARFFVGTHESTFTYRIYEEREIMGFHADTTFNRFCPKYNSVDCTPPTKWLIKYPEDEPWKHSTEYFVPDEL